MDSSPAIDAQEIVDIQRREGRELCRARKGSWNGLPRLVVRVLKRLDGQRPLHQVFSEVGLGARKGRAIVRKLTAMGLVERVETLCPEMRLDPFSELEEAFFASEVEPIDECDLPQPKLGDRVRSLVDRLRRGT